MAEEKKKLNKDGIEAGKLLSVAEYKAAFKAAKKKK